MYDKTLTVFMEEATVQSTKQLKFPQPMANSIVVKTQWIIIYCYSSQTC